MQFPYGDTQEFLVYCLDKFLNSFRGQDKFLLPESEDGTVYNNYPYPHTAVLSKKQNIAYHLQRFFNDITVTVDVLFPKEIKKMPSTFWGLFIELDGMGQLKFISSGNNCDIQGKENQKESKTAIYDLVKEIVLLDEYDYQNNYCGQLAVTFDLSKGTENLVPKIVKSINILYKINYQLYRRNYLKTKKKS